MSESRLRADIIGSARALITQRLTVGRSGNVSARCPGGLLITPSGVPYETLKPSDIVKLDLNGKVLQGGLKPSSEWHFHCAIMRARADVNAVVHAHPLYSTALACTGRGIPPFHYMIAEAGGKDIRCATYATYGTEELAYNVVMALVDRKACLLANHGSIAVGPTLEKAMKMAIELENLAAQYCEVLKIGRIQMLSDEQMNEVLDKYMFSGQAGPDQMKTSKEWITEIEGRLLARAGNPTHPWRSQETPTARKKPLSEQEINAIVSRYKK